ncbi:3'-5' exonuclease [Streptomyces antibioticus]|uniref:3'-5' exonuclease n=1 Tax=Streptomyces antibioticus TaxID=1890 RepID=UPI0033C5C4BF
MTITDPAQWEDLFTRTIDEYPAQFVRPADTDRPTWAVYDGGRYLGTLSAETDGGRPRWRVQNSGEAHPDVDDAVRALRRPAFWPREREQVARWARRLLADDGLLAVDVETTGLVDAYAVQIAAVDRTGTLVFNEYVQPHAVIEPGAVAVHGITPERIPKAPAFAELLPRLTEVFHGRTAVACKMDFDRGVVERELHRHHGDRYDVLGYDPSAQDVAFQAEADQRIAEENKTFGLVLLGVGCAVPAGRWAIRPVPA